MMEYNLRKNNLGEKFVDFLISWGVIFLLLIGDGYVIYISRFLFGSEWIPLFNWYIFLVLIIIFIFLIIYISITFRKSRKMKEWNRLVQLKEKNRKSGR